MQKISLKLFMNNFDIDNNPLYTLCPCKRVSPKDLLLIWICFLRTHPHPAERTNNKQHMIQ